MTTLFARRLHFVVGKGGVGKTTVTAALARLFVRRGRRTLAIEMDTSGRLPAVLGVGASIGAPTVVEPGLSVVSIDGRAALEEYLGLVIPVKRLLSTVFSSRIYQYFVAAAPGLKELMTVGKVWYEATRRDGTRPAWDVLVVDAPATGHGLQYLRMPQAARETFGAGLVQREATRVVELLQDPATTAVHLVTLAEDMPVTETLEAHAQIAGALHLPVGAVVVNRMHGRHFDPDVLAQLGRAADQAQGAERTLLAGVAERAIEEGGWAAINAQQVERLRTALGHVSIIELPYLFAEEFGGTELDVLSRRLEEGAALPALRRA
ncbi:MAG: ArsA family ATPase [Candidatus Binatia bacterium]